MEAIEEKLQLVLALKDKMTAELKKINKSISSTSTAFKSSFTKSFESADKQADKMLSTINSISKAIAKIGSIAGTITVGAFIGNGLKDFISLEQQLAQTASTGGFDKLSEEYKIIEEMSTKLGRETSKTATEVAEAMEKMYLAGWNTDDVTSSIEELIKFSIANNEDLVNVIDLVTDSTGATGLQIDELSVFMDKLTKASTKANATVGQFLETTLKSGAGLSAINTDMDNMIALQGILANSGFKGSESGTALNSLSNRLYKSTGEGATGRKMLGVDTVNTDGTVKSFDTLMQDIANSIQGKSEAEIAEAFTYLFGEYKAQGLALVKSFSDMQGDNEELTNKLMSIASDIASDDEDFDLSKLVENKASYYELLEEIKNNSDGAVQTKYDIQTDTLAQDLASLKSAFSGFSVAFTKAFGENARPIIQKFSQTLNDLSGKAEEVSQKIVAKLKIMFSFLKENKSTIIRLTAYISAFVGGFIGITKGYKAFKKLQDILGKFNIQPLKSLKLMLASFSLSNSIDGPLGVLKLLGQGLTNLLNPIKAIKLVFTGLKTVILANPFFAVAIAIAGLIFAMVKLYKTSATFRNRVKDIFEKIKQHFINFGERFKGLYEEKIKPCWERIKSCFVDGEGKVKAVWVNLFTMLLDVVEWLIGNLMTVLGDIIEFAVGFVTGICDIFYGICEFIAGVFTGDWERAWQGITGVFDGFKNMFLNIINLLKNSFNSFVDSIKRGWETIKKWFSWSKSNIDNLETFEIYQNVAVSQTSPLGNADDRQTNKLLQSIPQNALGTSYFSGGLTTINERGGELVNLRSGAKILPADKTDKLFEGLGGDIILNLTINGNVIGEDEYINKLGNVFAKRIVKVIPNMA